MSSEVRLGYVSSIDYEAGKCEITYPDKDDTVTAPAPMLCNREYNMPNVGDLVVVLHPGDCPEDAVILGSHWTDDYKPESGKEKLWRKDFCEEQGKAYESYDEDKGVFLQHSDKEIQRKSDGKITDSAKKAYELEAENVTIKAGGTTVEVAKSGAVTITGAAGITISATSNLALKAGGTLSINATSFSATAATVNISGGAGDVKVQGVSLTAHTHTSATRGSPTTPPIPT